MCVCVFKWKPACFPMVPPLSQTPPINSCFQIAVNHQTIGLLGVFYFRGIIYDYIIYVYNHQIAGKGS